MSAADEATETVLRTYAARLLAEIPANRSDELCGWIASTGLEVLDRGIAAFTLESFGLDAEPLRTAPTGHVVVVVVHEKLAVLTTADRSRAALKALAEVPS